VVYPQVERVAAASSARLVWLILLHDFSIPARNLYVIDALDGMIVDVQSQLYTGRDRRTYNAFNTTSLPGTLARTEGQGPVGDADIDNAHDFAGDIYDYFSNVHGRDSYDNGGGAIHSTAHYGVNYLNAFWNGVRLVYGDGMPVNDIVGHEFTHGVTQYTAGLVYRWQSGALNESVSDVFGVAIDPADWLIGEDSPLGAIRDMSNPPAYGQPGHTDDWFATCEDEEGVHTNSGITNKAFYNIATTIDRTSAERIFYRALTVYLSAEASLEDMRAAALQSARDLFGTGSAEETAAQNGFNAVGLDGTFNPPPNFCPCPATVTLADKQLYSDRLSAIEVAATLYRTRDELLSTTAVGERYTELYYQHVGRISYLLLRHSELRAMAAEVLREVTPGLTLLLDGHGDRARVSKEMVTEVNTFLHALAAADKAGELVEAIKRERERINLKDLAGLSFTEAWKALNNNQALSQVQK